MEILKKLSAIQTRMKAPKNLENNFGGFKYRNAEGILEAFKPYAKEYGVALILEDDIVLVGDRVYVKATATIYDIETGESKSTSALAREPLEKKGSDASQITGATSSYARKYALNGLFLLDDTKDADSNEETAKRQGIKTPEEFNEAMADMQKTEEVRGEKMSDGRIEILMKKLSENGLSAKDVYNHFGVKKKSDLTYGIERQIYDNMKTLVEKYGSKGEAE